MWLGEEDVYTVNMCVYTVHVWVRRGRVVRRGRYVYSEHVPNRSVAVQIHTLTQKGVWFSLGWLVTNSFVQADLSRALFE